MRHLLYIDRNHPGLHTMCVYVVCVCGVTSKSRLSDIIFWLFLAFMIKNHYEIVEEKNNNIWFGLENENGTNATEDENYVSYTRK